MTADAAERLEGLIAAGWPAVLSPFDGLNALLSGACAVLATDLSGGKTMLASQIAGHAAVGVPVASE